MENPLFFEKSVISFQISQELVHIGLILKHNQMVQYLNNKRPVLDDE